jgi:MFS family permease
LEKVFKKRYYFIFLSTILGPLTTNALVPIFEQLRINFGLSSISMISLAIFIYILPFAALQLFSGTFSDIIDRKKVVNVGFLIFLSGLLIVLISVVSKNFILFLVGFFIQGIGFAFINPTILAILSSITPEEKEGMIMGIYNSSAGIGISFGAIISGVLANLHWELLFIINPIITLLSLILFLFALHGCETYICRTYEDKEDSPSEKLAERIKGTFIKLRENLTRNILLLGFIGFFCFFSVITLTNTLNEQIRIAISNLSEEEIISSVSFILTINGLISISLSPITGTLLKKVKPLSMMKIGFVLMLGIIFMPLGTSLIHFMLISFSIYVGSAFIWPALFKKAMDTRADLKGTNSSIVNSLRFFGYAIVSPFYVLVGIPIIYFVVISFDLTAIMIAFVLSKGWKKTKIKEEKEKLEKRR